MVLRLQVEGAGEVGEGEGEREAERQSGGEKQRGREEAKEKKEAEEPLRRLARQVSSGGGDAGGEGSRREGSLGKGVGGSSVL